jgi:DNA-binding FrmR family transcriptional regulator
MRKSMAHATHSDIVKRLKRADGHLQTIITMIEEGRPCVDLAQQLQAVEKAIDNAKKALIHDHINHCLEGSLRVPGGKGRAAIAELKTITKYL